MTNLFNVPSLIKLEIAPLINDRDNVFLQSHIFYLICLRFSFILIFFSTRRLEQCTWKTTLVSTVFRQYVPKFDCMHKDAKSRLKPSTNSRFSLKHTIQNIVENFSQKVFFACDLPSNCFRIGHMDYIITLTSYNVQHWITKEWDFNYTRISVKKTSLLFVYLILKFIYFSLNNNDLPSN